MNIILFKQDEATASLDINDARAIHLCNVLKLKAGDQVYIGVINGKISHSRILSVSSSEIVFKHNWNINPEPLYPIELLVAIPRPQTAKKILFECSALGISKFHFLPTDKSEKSYASSKLWTNGEYKDQLELGIIQSFTTQIPELNIYPNLDNFLQKYNLKNSSNTKIVLDNYESSKSISAVDFNTGSIIAIGGERGWSTKERNLFRDNNFTLVNLGKRVLRSETACVVASGIVASKLGIY